MIKTLDVWDFIRALTILAEFEGLARDSGGPDANSRAVRVLQRLWAGKLPQSFGAVEVVSKPFNATQLLTLAVKLSNRSTFGLHDTAQRKEKS